MLLISGQQEVKLLVKKLQNAFPLRNRKFNSKDKNETEFEEQLDDELTDAIRRVKKVRKKKTQISLPEINLDK